MELICAQAMMDFESQEDGYVGKILIPSNTENVKIGEVCLGYFCILSTFAIACTKRLIDVFCFDFPPSCWRVTANPCVSGR
jgi:hypothetical protein